LNQIDNIDANARPPREDTELSSAQSSEWIRLVFHGSGGEYFRIWIVNLLLTILTLGIYSAWATVRQRRYLYGCTELAGSRFEFHGRPLQILLGRVIALVLLVAWTQGHLIHIAVPLVALVVLLCLFPWFMVKAMRFRLRNSSLRNLRFDFRGTTPGAYRLTLRYLLYAGLLIAGPMVFMLLTVGKLDPENLPDAADMRFFAAFMGMYALCMVALTFLYPAFVCDTKGFSINNTWYGDHPFSVSLKKGDFIQFFWIAIGLSVVLTSVAMFAMVVLAMIGAFIGVVGEQGPAVAIGGIVVGYLLMGLSFSFAFSFWQARVFQAQFATLRLGDMAFKSDISVIRLGTILVVNSLMMIFSFGLAYPWVVVRLLKYRLESVSYRGDPNAFCGTRISDSSAIGDEVGQAFDLDFGFG